MCYKILGIGIIISFIMLAGSCDKSEDLSPLPEKLIISLTEVFHADSSQIILKVKSEEDYPCSNFEIIHSVSKSGSTNIIEFEGITNHGFCHTANAPAQGTVYISNGNNYNTLTFKFILNDDSDEFDFKITENAVEINKKGTSSGRITYNYSSLIRLHRNTFWGYTKIKDGSTPDSVHSSLLEDFYEAGAENLELPDGYYGYFIVENEKISFITDNDIDAENITPFVFIFDGSLNDICEIASDFDEYLQIFVRNTLGEKCEIR